MQHFECLICRILTALLLFLNVPTSLPLFLLRFLVSRYTVFFFLVAVIRPCTFIHTVYRCPRFSPKLSIYCCGISIGIGWPGISMFAGGQLPFLKFRVLLSLSLSLSLWISFDNTRLIDFLKISLVSSIVMMCSL